jgi:2-polyprenyl-6-methoxyphenol hydroxylase-like FAD-dependent oxidoreductase
MRGHRILEDLFPSITTDWEKAGGEVLDVGRDFAWRTPAGWGVRFDSGIQFLAASRALIDTVVQRRLAAVENVSVMQGATVLGLVTDQQRNRVTGVGVRLADGDETVIAADLTVDALGRMSPTPSWLEHLGCEAPRETIVDARLGYATRLYRRRPEQERDWRGVFIQAAPPQQPRAGIALPVEGNRWIVTLCGGGGDYAPLSEPEFVEFARSLPSGEVYNLIRDAEPAGPIAGYRRTENRWRHYESLSRQPEGFIVLGDAACAFNPVYGQGMTTAGLGALTLDACLRAHRGDVPARRFQKQLAKVIATPWALATGEDIRYPGSEAQPKLAEQMLQKYVHRVMAVSTHNPDVRRALLEVFTMMAEPVRLLQPGVVSKVVAGFFSKRAAWRADLPAHPQGNARGAAA